MLEGGRILKITRSSNEKREKSIVPKCSQIEASTAMNINKKYAPRISHLVIFVF